MQCLTDLRVSRGYVGQGCSVGTQVRGIFEGFTPAQAAREAGISRQTVRNILRGETWMDLPTLYRLEQYLPVKLWTSNKWPKHKKS